MSKHTQGPWFHDLERSMGGAPVIVGLRNDRPRLREVAKVLYDNGSDDPEVHANARLIAAAPELLAVCQEFLNALGPDGYHPIPGAPATARMRKAVARATGVRINPQGPELMEALSESLGRGRDE